MDEFEKLEDLFAEVSKRQRSINKQLDHLINVYLKANEQEKVNSLRLYKATMVERLTERDLLDDADEHPLWST